MKIRNTIATLTSIFLAICFCMPFPAGSAANAENEPEGFSGVYFAQTGSRIEHTPSIIQVSNGTFFMAYESGSSSWHFTINLTWSHDGILWAPGRVIVSSAGSYGNRHPTLIQRHDGDLQVVYLTDRSGSYQLYTSISQTGNSWTEYGPLGVSGPAINPFIILRENGQYAMSYQRYGSNPSSTRGSWFSTSADGITWSSGVQVSTYALPRLMEYEPGKFLMTYQGGTTGSTFDIRYKTSTGGSTWSAETRLTFTGNSHDSFPIKLVNGTYMVFFCTAVGGQYDLYRKWSADLSTWSADEHIPTNNARFDTQPHPVQLQSNQSFLLSWGYESSGAVGAYENVDIALLWIEDIAAPPPFERELSAGWNLISLPLELANTSVESVLSSIAGEWSVVKYYDGTNRAWKTHRVGGSMNTLSDIDHSMGFWVNVNSTCTLSVSGSQPATTQIQLKTGWNLVGYPSGTSRLASVTLPGEADMVSVFQAASPYVQDFNDKSLVTMSAGNGYWVRVTADCVWDVPW